MTIQYIYYFKTRTGLRVNYKSTNAEYAKQILANRHNIKKSKLKIIKRVKI